MSPLWILAGGAAALALTRKDAPIPPPTQPQLPPALPKNPTGAFVPPVLPKALPATTSQLLTPDKIGAAAGGVVKTGGKLIAAGGGILAVAKFVAPTLTSSLTSTVSSTASSIATSVWTTVAPFVGLAIFVAFAIVAMIPLVFVLVGILTRELRRPGAEFQETYKMAMQMKESITLQMRGDALKGSLAAGTGQLTPEKLLLIDRLRDIWLTEFINQWNDCRKKAASFEDWQGKQGSNKVGDAAHIQWVKDRGFFLSDDDVDTLESIVLYNSEPLTEDQLAWANYPYKQFVQFPSAPWVKVFADARASGIQESQWQYIVQSAHAFANAQYFLYGSQKARDGLGWIGWGPMDHPATATNQEYLDWSNFMTGAQWIPGIWLEAGCAGVMYDSIDPNGDIHFRNTVIRVRESLSSNPIRPVVAFLNIPPEFQTPKAA